MVLHLEVVVVVVSGVVGVRSAVKTIQDPQTDAFVENLETKKRPPDPTKINIVERVVLGIL